MKRVDIWETAPRLETRPATRKRPVRSIAHRVPTARAVLLDGGRVISVGGDRSIGFIGQPSAPRLTWPASKTLPVALCASTRGQQLAAVRDGALFLWDLRQRN